MSSDPINDAIITSIAGSAAPRVDRQVLIDRYGRDEGGALADHVMELVREAVAMPIEWEAMSLAEGVSDMMTRFGQRHPELSDEALVEISRCVGWQLR